MRFRNLKVDFLFIYDIIGHMNNNSCKSDTAPGSVWGMRAVLELSKIGAIGNANLEVTGLDNLQASIKQSRQREIGAIVASSHITNADLSLAAVYAAKCSDVAFAVTSVNYGYWHQKLAYKILGNENFIPVPFEHVEDNPSMHRPGRFDARDYRQMEEILHGGDKTLMVAAHSPVDNTVGRGFVNGILPSREKTGILASHLSLMTGALVVPSLVEFEGQSEHPGHNTMDTIDFSFLFKKKDVHIGFGPQIKPDKSEMNNYRDVVLNPDNNKLSAIKKQRTLARTFGVQIMDSIYDMQKLS